MKFQLNRFIKSERKTFRCLESQVILWASFSILVVLQESLALLQYYHFLLRRSVIEPDTLLFLESFLEGIFELLSGLLFFKLGTLTFVKWGHGPWREHLMFTSRVLICSLVLVLWSKHRREIVRSLIYLFGILSSLHKSCCLMFSTK